MQQDAAAVRTLPGGKQVLLHEVLAGDKVRLPEHEAKALLKAAGMMVPDGKTVTSADAAADIMLEFERVIIKPLGTGEERDAGMAISAGTPGDARTAASFLLGISPMVLVERRVSTARELYLSVRTDNASTNPTLLAGADGLRGRTSRLPINMSLGLSADGAMAVADDIGLEGPLAYAFAKAALEAWKVFNSMGAEFLEISPLASDIDGKLIAVDALLTVCDDPVRRAGQRD